MARAYLIGLVRRIGSRTESDASRELLFLFHLFENGYVGLLDRRIITTRCRRPSALIFGFCLAEK